LRGFKPTSHAKVCIWNQNWVVGFLKERELNYDFCLEDIVKGEVFSKLRRVPSREEATEAIRQLLMNFRQN
jgi:hypothetical protein